jgi:protein SCO1/2
MLMGEPIAMLVALMIIAGNAFPAAVRAVISRTTGKIAVGGLGLLLVVALVGVSVGVVRGGRPVGGRSGTTAAPVSIERVDRTAPRIDLVDQEGEFTSLDSMRGHVVLVGFVFGHCETVCPTVVQTLLEARRRLGSAAPAVVLVTLDPWRDTPSRLSSIAERWNLSANMFLVGGDVAQVERTLDSWNVARARDELTGNVVHAVPIYVVNPDGRIVYRVPPFTEAIVNVVRSLPVSE